MENSKESFDLSQLPKTKGWSKPDSTLYQGYWFPSPFLQNVIAFHHQFQAHYQDIILASHPKSGSTWLKALVFSVVNRRRYAASETPLLTTDPHALIPFHDILPPSHAADGGGKPRLLSTRIPHAVLPESIAGGECRIVYVCRNPLDTVVSFWQFLTRGHPDSFGPGWTVEDCAETFCSGESSFGPFWDHVLGFWKASLERPEKVLFLKYEEVMEDTASQVKRIAEFLGFPFSEEEERSGVVKEIVEFCSLRKMKELEVNKHGMSKFVPNMANKLFFRKGEVGDWVNYLSPSMAETVKKVVEEKLRGSGLTFKYSLQAGEK